MAVELRNPHSVLAALETRPKQVIEVRLQSDIAHGVWGKVAEMARRSNIPVRLGTGRRKAGRRSRKDTSDKSGRIGIGEATVKENAGTTLERLFTDSSERASGRGLWLALDCLQDPHNVGAIFRSAAFFGVEGIVLTRDRSAPLNATVYDVSCGGVEYVPFVVETNLSRVLDRAKDTGLWVLGASEHAETEISQIERDRPWLLVLGNEEKGLRRLTLGKCDSVCRLMPRGSVTSLNVSVAAGILIANLTDAV